MKNKKLSRRDFLRMGAVGAAGAALASCKPQVVKETVVVEKPVEKVVKETVIVEGTPQVVEKVVTATPAPLEPITIKLTSIYEVPVYDYVKEMIADRGLNIDFQWDTTPIKAAGWAGFCDAGITRIASGEQIDLIDVATEGFLLFICKGLVRPIDEFLNADTEYSKDVEEDFHPTLLNVMRWQGKLWSLPRGWNNNMIHYNYKMFEEKGVPEPGPDWTWDDFLQTCLALADVQGKEDDVYAFGWLNWTFGYDPWFYNNGTSCLTEDEMDSNMLDPKVAETLQFLKDLISVHKVAPIPGWNAWGEFDARHCAMIQCGSWCLPAAIEQEFYDYKFQLHPNNGGQLRTVLGMGGELMMKACKHPDAAWEVYKIVSSQEFHMYSMLNIGGWLPDARRSCLESKEFLSSVDPALADMSIFLRSLDVGKATIHPPNYNIVEPLMNRWFSRLWVDEIGTEECVTGCHEELQLEMDKMQEDLGL